MLTSFSELDDQNIIFIMDVNLLLRKIFDPAWEISRFPAWMANQVEGCDCVVALARAAPRLLDIFGLTDQSQRPVICERAMAFMPRDYFAGKRVLVFDDSINFGSTMEETRSRLVALGAFPICAAIAVDRNTFYGEHGPEHALTQDGDMSQPVASTQPSPYLKTLKPRGMLQLYNHGMKSFHNMGVQLIQHLGMPYTLDFPIFDTSMAMSIKQVDPRAIRHLFAGFQHVYDMPHLCGKGSLSQIFSLSIPISHAFLKKILPDVNGLFLWGNHSKLRMFFDYEKCQVRTSAMIQVVTMKAASVASPCLLPDILSNDIANLAYRELANGSFTPEDEEYRYAIHRIITYALSATVACHMWHTLVRDGLKNHLHDGSTFKLHQSDGDYLFGPSLAYSIRQLVNGWRAETEETPAPWRDEFFRHQPFDGRMQEIKLPENPIKLEIQKRNNEREHAVGGSNSKDILDRFGNLMPDLREFVDLGRRNMEDSRQSTSSAHRLHNGLSYWDLMELLGVDSASPEQQRHLGFAMDLLVDGGMLVPQLKYYQTENMVVRLYRCGENDSAQPINQMKKLLHTLLTEHESIQAEEAGHDTDPITERAFAKILVIMKRFHGSDIPYQLGIDTYGVVPYFETEQIIEWMKEHGLAERIP